MKKLCKVLLVLTVAFVSLSILDAGVSLGQPPADPFDGQGFGNDAFEQPGAAEGGIAALLGGGTMCGCGFFAIVIGLAVAALSFWKLFEKAGKPGWASIVPIYNTIVLIEIAGRPLWWIVLYLIPCVNLVVHFIVCIDVARKFGQEAIFGVGMGFFPYIFGPILGFGSARYNPAA